MFGGSFLGTTVFWLTFDYNLLRRKEIEKLKKNDNELKQKLDNNLSAFNKSIDELKGEFKGELKEILKRFPQKPDSPDKNTKESTET